MSERERLAAFTVAYLKSLDYYDSPYVDASNIEDTVIDGNVDMLAFADAILIAGFGDVAQIKAERDAALAVIAEVREELLCDATAYDIHKLLNRRAAL